MEALERAVTLQASPDLPLIVFVDELDKVPEKKDGKEVSQPVISHLNGILSEGHTSDLRFGKNLNFSNIFVLSAMNFAPSQIEAFSKEILSKEKSFWDFSEEDMIKFDQWIRSSDAAQASVAKVLSLLFRSNTVSRLIPDAVVAKALYGDDFDHIVKLSTQAAVERLSKNKSVGLRVKTTDHYLNFLRKTTVFAPSGARMSVKRADLLTEQLITMAIRVDLNLPVTFSLPRDVEIDYDADKNVAIINVQALIKNGSKTEVKASQQIALTYNPTIGSFEFPKDLIKSIPENLVKKAEDHAAVEAKRKLTRAQIAASRDLLQNDHSLEKHLNSVIFDQAELAESLDRNLQLYINSEEKSVRYQTIPGFTGVGKTAIVMAAAEKLGIPVVKMNMQEYSGDAQEAADKFGEDLYNRIQLAKMQSKTGKFIVLLEELDKCYEVDPSDGKPVRRPVLAYVKDLLTDGKRKVTVKNAWSSQQMEIDINGAYAVLTMNFAVDQFDLKSDPRLTTIEDMQDLYEQISSSPDAINSLFKTIFLPETINRLISNSMQIARPLSHEGYQNIISEQIEEALHDLSSSTKSSKNHTGVTIKFTPSYRDEYLFAEAVIPSQGGRQAAQSAKALILKDTLEAIANLPKNSPLYSKPIEITLDYKRKTKTTNPTVQASAKLSEKSDKTKAKSDMQQELYSSERILRFPPMIEFRNMPAKRVHVASHEFGHAFAAVFFGFRFEYATAVSPNPSIGGYVKPRKLDFETGKSLLADLMVSIGSRAMERIIFSANPENPESVLNVTSGPTTDIQMATTTIWNIIHQLGMDPNGGVIERSGLAGNHRDDYLHRKYFFSEIPDEKITQLSMVIRDLENFLVKEMLQAHDLKWYQSKITTFARRGGLNESDFYELIGYSYPGDNRIFIGEELALSTRFEKSLIVEPTSVVEARRFQQGNGRTAPQNMERLFKTFQDILSYRLHTNSCKDRLTK